MSLTSNLPEESSSLPTPSEKLEQSVDSKICSTKRKMVKIVVFLVLILFLASLFFFLLKSNFLIQGLAGKKNAWQAVFLTSGQVYFGTINRETKNVLVLKKVYYLQFNQEQQEGQTVVPQLSVVKLGQEPHGPEDEMRINKEHIIFIEDLRADSDVVRTIENLEKIK